MDQAARPLRDRFYGRGVHGLARLPLYAPLPGDGARATGGGSRLDRVPERGLFLLRPAVGPVLGGLVRALRSHSDHRPQRLCRNGGLRGLWLAQNRWEAAFALLLVGFQLGNTGVMLTALRAVAPRGRVGFAISLFGVTPSLGFALGPAIGGALVSRGVLNLHSLFALDAVMSLAAGAILLAFARQGPRPPRPSGSAIQLAVGALRLALTGRFTLIVFGIFGLAYFAQQIANPFLPLLVIRIVGGSAGAAGQIGIVFGASALFGALLSPLAGAAGDRFGFRPLLAGACVLAAASLAELAMAPNLVWLTVGAVALGAATATAISMVFALLATAVPEERRATTLNLVLLPLYFSSVAGGIVGGLLVHNGLNTVLWAGAAISLVAALLTTRLPSPARTTQ